MNAERIRRASQGVLDFSVRLGTGAGHDITVPLAHLLDRCALAAERFEAEHYGVEGEHIAELDSLVETIERVTR